MCGRIPNKRQLRSTLVAAGVSGRTLSCLWGLPVSPLTPLLRLLALRRPHNKAHDDEGRMGECEGDAENEEEGAWALCSGAAGSRTRR